MKKVEVHDHKLTVVVPDGFYEMTAEQIQEIATKPVEKEWILQNEWAMRSDEKHMFLEISWKKAPLISFLAKLEETVSYTEKSVAKVVPSYSKVSDIRRTICGEKTCGFRYSYIASEVDMVSDYMIFKHGKEYYYILCAARKEWFEESQNVLDTFLENMKLN